MRSETIECWMSWTLNVRRSIMNSITSWWWVVRSAHVKRLLCLSGQWLNLSKIWGSLIKLCHNLSLSNWGWTTTTLLSKRLSDREMSLTLGSWASIGWGIVTSIGWEVLQFWWILQLTTNTKKKTVIAGLKDQDGTKSWRHLGQQLAYSATLMSLR